MKNKLIPFLLGAALVVLIAAGGGTLYVGSFKDDGSGRTSIPVADIVGAGTVTSVGANGPLWATWSPPVTTSGTLTMTPVAQSANVVLAGPVSGVPATPAFRALTSNDLAGVVVNDGSLSSNVMLLNPASQTLAGNLIVAGTTTHATDNITSANVGGETVTNTITTSNVAAGSGVGTDIAGTNLTLSAGASTGAGLPGSIIFQESWTNTTGSTANVKVPKAYYNSKIVNVSNNTVTVICNISLASGKTCGGTLVIDAVVQNGTDLGRRHEFQNFSAVNKAGTVTASGGLTASSAVAITSGTATSAVTFVANGNGFDIKQSFNASMSTPTIEYVKWTILELDTDDATLAVTPL